MLAWHPARAARTRRRPRGIERMQTGMRSTRGASADRPAPAVGGARQEHLTVARRMLAAHPEIGALVLECTNMPPYRADLQAATGLPVFDITTLVRMVHDAVSQGLPPRPA